MSKIVFLDIDGTIRGFDGKVPETAIRAIRQARENGHEVLISSGRPLCQIEPRILDIGFDGIISGSGSYVVYRGQCIRYEYFPRDFYEEITEALLANRCLMELHRHDKSCIIQSQLADYEQLVLGIQALLGKDAKKIVEMPSIVENAAALDKVEKILYFSDDFSNDDILARWGGRLYVVPLSFPNTRRWGGEISLASVNKAKGIECVLAAAGCSKEDTVAVGDSENDIEMLELAGLGIAMGNGTPAVKAAADALTDSVENDGLYKAFVMAGLIS